jgi:hypothetical protein
VLGGSAVSGCPPAACLGGLHLGNALLQEVGDLLEALRLVADALGEVGQQLVDLLAQALLHQPTTTELSCSFCGRAVLRSRWMLKVAAMICRCCSESAPTWFCCRRPRPAAPCDSAF